MSRPVIRHLIDDLHHTPAPATLAWVADWITQSAGTWDHQVFLVGSSPLNQQARAMGIQPAHHWITGPTWPLFQAAELPWRWHDQHHNTRILCWSWTALLLARWLPAQARILCIDAGEHMSMPNGLTARYCTPQPDAVICLTQTVADRLAEQLPANTPIHVIEPAMDPHRLAACDRTQLRQQWQVDEQTRAVALISDSPRPQRALYAGWTVGLAQQSGRPLKLILPDNLPDENRMFQVIDDLNLQWVIVDDLATMPWRILPACDMAIQFGGLTQLVEQNVALSLQDTTGIGGGLAMRWAIRANLPIVSEKSTAVEPLLSHDRTALLSDPARPRQMAWQINRLCDQPALGRNIAAQAIDRLNNHTNATDPLQQIIADLNRCCTMVA